MVSSALNEYLKCETIEEAVLFVELEIIQFSLQETALDPINLVLKLLSSVFTCDRDENFKFAISEQVVRKYADAVHFRKIEG
jgi:hypothetical protein